MTARKNSAVAVKTAASSEAAAKTGAAEKKTPAKKTPAKKTPAKKTPAKTTAEKKTPAKTAPAKKAPAKKAPAKKAPARRAPAKKAAEKRLPLAVREDESAWTASELDEVRTTLEADDVRLTAEIATTEVEIGHLLREGGEGAGNDQADVGSNTFERDHEMSMAKHARESLELVQAALGRIEQGTYGVCESCEQPIGKMRLQAFPRATLCMQCKQRQERR